MYSIATFKRFIYLNAYAFLLLDIGILGCFFPDENETGWLKITEWAIVLFCFWGAVSIFSKWNRKKRQYRILIEKNSNELQLESFRRHMKAPCGRLLVRLVLKDLGYGKKEWKSLVKTHGNTIRIIVHCNKNRTYSFKI